MKCIGTLVVDQWTSMHKLLVDQQMNKSLKSSFPFNERSTARPIKIFNFEGAAGGAKQSQTNPTQQSNSTINFINWLIWFVWVCFGCCCALGCLSLLSFHSKSSLQPYFYNIFSFSSINQKDSLNFMKRKFTFLWVKWNEDWFDLLVASSIQSFHDW